MNLKMLRQFSSFKIHPSGFKMLKASVQWRETNQLELVGIERITDVDRLMNGTFKVSMGD